MIPSLWHLDSRFGFNVVEVAWLGTAPYDSCHWKRSQLQCGLLYQLPRLRSCHDPLDGAMLLKRSASDPCAECKARSSSGPLDQHLCDSLAGICHYAYEQTLQQELVL